jgi:hypothetical protein
MLGSLVPFFVAQGGCSGFSIQQTLQKHACGVGERCGNRANQQCGEA